VELYQFQFKVMQLQLEDQELVVVLDLHHKMVDQVQIQFFQQ
tara:strand:+ start:114 stop:239 length:126 start_codon:yes stop_codon:yes gene_type:complete